MPSPGGAPAWRRRHPEEAASVMAWHAAHPAAPRKRCAEALGLPYHHVCLAARGTGWADAKAKGEGPSVAAWLAANPQGARARCADELGLTYAQVARAAREGGLEWPAATARDVPAAEAVAAWRERNPHGTRARCARELGLAYSTVCACARGCGWPPADGRDRP